MPETRQESLFRLKRVPWTNFLVYCISAGLCTMHCLYQREDGEQTAWRGGVRVSECKKELKNKTLEKKRLILVFK